MSVGSDGRRVCLLTGAAGRLGGVLCRTQSERYDIVAVYRNRWPAVASQDHVPVDPLDPAAPPAGRPVFAVKADLTAAGACDAVVQRAVDRFGRIDLVVNAAVSSTWAPMFGSDRLLRSAERQLTTNVVVPLRLAAAVAAHCWQGRDDDNRAANRNVVNVSSVAARRLYTGSGQSVYAASKAALEMLTGHMAVEFASVGVRVNAVAPNSFPGLVPTRRAVDAIVALDAGDATGTVVIVDGEEDETVALAPYR